MMGGGERRSVCFFCLFYLALYQISSTISALLDTFFRILVPFLDINFLLFLFFEHIFRRFGRGGSLTGVPGAETKRIQLGELLIISMGCIMGRGSRRYDSNERFMNS